MCLLQHKAASINFSSQLKIYFLHQTFLHISGLLSSVSLVFVILKLEQNLLHLPLPLPARARVDRDKLRPPSAHIGGSSVHGEDQEVLFSRLQNKFFGFDLAPSNIIFFFFILS